MKLLLIRMLGLGDVAAIAIPAARILRRHYPQAELHVLTYAAGGELMALVEQVDKVITVPASAWPNDLEPGLNSFAAIANDIVATGYDLVYNLDTWFLPCFLARLLRDSGMRLRGNYLQCSTRELLEQVRGGTLTQEYASWPKHYLRSTFANMHVWTNTAWWQTYPNAGAYPQFYLQHCCGFRQHLDMRLPIGADPQLRAEAANRPIIALAASARTRNRQYPHAQALTKLLTDAGCLVWSQFDGSLPLPQSLARLRVSDLLISVASAPQWLAATVDCPTLLIPGPVPPQVLQAQLTVAAHLDCQFCLQENCVADRDFACMNVPPEQIAAQALTFVHNICSPAAGGLYIIPAGRAD